ncbi:MAG: two-component regulator propeller domain-containing protein, partial [Bacteroidia bacterium]
NNYVKTIFETDAGIIFIGTYGGGVSKYLPKLEANKYDGPLFQTISSKHGLSNDRVLSIIEDREKNIWIGTLLNLNQYFDEQFEIYGENEGLQNSLVWSIIQDKRGTFWIGTEQGLVQFIPESYGKESNQKLINSINNKKEARFIRKSGKEGQIVNTTALYEDMNGNIWFTDFGRGLSMLNPLNGQIKTFSTKNGLSVNEIYCINGDKKGNIWIGTNNGGLLKYNLKTEKFKNYTTADGIGSNQIYTIYCDTKNRLWLGSLTGNLTMVNQENGDNDQYHFVNFSEKQGYPSKFTISITEDMEGNMWFGTYDMGLYKYDDKVFKNYTTKDGIISNTPFLLVCDNHNNLWIGTGLGIDKFNLKDETFKHYEKDDGFLGIEINPNASCKDSDGNLWFGSIIGLVKYKSKFERTNLMESITTIEEPRVFFQKIKIPKDHEFSWNENHLTFDFIGNSLTNPKRVKYRYMLEGVDNDWSPIVKENSVTYPSIQPGSYSFKVRSCNNDGVWNKIPVTFKFTITPPFWKTIWFYVISAIILLSGFYLYMKYKERKLKAANILLEEKVVERTEEVVKQKKEIERKNTIITDSLEYAKDIQFALLPATDEMDKIFKNHFVLYKPKDIVSGDFYWLYEDSERRLIAVADCTGHGVPGAFVSLLGYNLLNEIVSDNKNLTPGQILEDLNSRILASLKQNDEYASAKYGMDISLISISKDLQKLQFAGAHNSLFVFRGNETFEITANKFSIGSSRRVKDMEFTDKSFEINRGDMIYMFTDGYKDQMGGSENKRFFAKPFRILLQSISSLEMAEQKSKLDETIIDWKGNKSQTDDILIIGIRI